MKNQNNWRNQLHNRKIVPSDEAWLAIESGLEKKDTNKLKKKFAFSLIAASIIGFVVFVSLPSQAIEASKTNIVDVKSPNKLEKTLSPQALSLDVNSMISVNESVIIETEIIQEESLIIASQQAKPNIKINSGAISETSLEIISENSLKTIPETNIASIEINVEIITAEKKNPDVSEKAVQLLAEVEAELAGVSFPNTTYNADDEASLLLAEAKLIIQEVEYQKLYEFAQATDLLAEVENNISKDNLQNRVWSFVKDNVKNLESTLASLK